MKLLGLEKLLDVNYVYQVEILVGAAVIAFTVYILYSLGLFNIKK